MIDENFNPWLIEINTNPCLELSCPLLERIVPNLIEQTFRYIFYNVEFVLIHFFHPHKHGQTQKSNFLVIMHFLKINLSSFSMRKQIAMRQRNCIKDKQILCNTWAISKKMETHLKMMETISGKSK